MVSRWGVWILRITMVSLIYNITIKSQTCEWNVSDLNVDDSIDAIKWTEYINMVDLLTLLQGRQLLWRLVLFSCTPTPSEKGSNLERKNLLPIGSNLLVLLSCKPTTSEKGSNLNEWISSPVRAPLLSSESNLFSFKVDHFSKRKQNNFDNCVPWKCIMFYLKR